MCKEIELLKITNTSSLEVRKLTAHLIADYRHNRDPACWNTMIDKLINQGAPTQLKNLKEDKNGQYPI